METLQSTIFIEFDVNTKKITFLRGDNIINCDSNITNIYVRVKYKNLSGNTVYLTPSELEGYKFSLYTIKPATNNINMIIGEVTNELKENVYGGIVKFEIPRACTNRLGIVKCEIHINQGNKVIGSSTFVLDVQQSLVMAFNDELLDDEDFPVLKQLVLEIQKASNIDDSNRSKITTYSSDKIEDIKTNLNLQIKEKGDRIETVKEELSSQIKEIANIVGDTINIKQFPRLNSETSDTGRIKRAIDYCIDAIKDGHTNVKIIEFGSGCYDIVETINIPVFVKIKSKGNVVFNSKVKGTLFKLYTPSNISFPSLSNDVFTFNRGAWLDGAIIIKLDNSISVVDTVAIEIGNSVDDAPGHRYFTGWYSLNDILITGFQIGIKFNSYHNYLGKFDRIIVAKCEKGLLFNGTTVMNSGESFSFNDSIFCNSDVCCYISSWSDLEIVFNGCSFDFNSRCLETSTEGVIRFSNCHFEGIGFEDNGSEKGGNDSCIVLTKGDYFSAPNIFVSGSDIMSARDTLFKSVNKNGMNLFIEGLTTKGSKDFRKLYALCDDNVDISVNNFVSSKYLSMITQRKLNRKINSNFENIENQPITNGMTIEGYTFGNDNFTGRAEITNEKFFKNGKSLKITVPAGGQWCTLSSEEFECKPADKILNNFYWFTETSETNGLGRMGIVTHFYDKDGNVLTYPATKIDSGTILGFSTNNEWNRLKQMEYVVAPQNSKKCKIEYIINPVGECTLYLAEFYTSIY